MRHGWRYVMLATAGSILLLWIFCLPRELFEGVVYSTVVTDRNGKPLGARVADDGQWRFPPCDTLSEKFVKALIEFEDRTFYHHAGVSLRALGRAAWQNLRSGHVVSGGSTLSMQVIRLSRRRPRTLWQKTVEVFMATRLEWRYSKEEILRLYASHAPFGGNVVGIDAALWRYLGDDGAELSWAEAATLAVLQNAPSAIHLARNRDALLAKRNRLLGRLKEKGELSDEDYTLAVDEPLVGNPHPMPQHAVHLVERYDRTAHGRQTATRIDLPLQRRVEELTTRWSRELRMSDIRDLAAVVVEVSSGQVVAYCGNSDMTFERDGKWVDIARAPRSSGSILKPLLYAAALQEGTILPHTLLPDVPMDFGGFAPKNFDGAYAGAVAADEALAQSLNIPNVHLLKEFGVRRFAETLQRAGFASLDRPADHYGLSLVLGGAEVALTDVVSCYASMAACYADSTCCTGFPLRDRMALHYTFEAMREVNRPDQMDWRRAASVQNVAWKTGTSYGSRDAWAVGVTPEYAVGVWVGNADGSGVADLTGARTAGPVLFDLFALLPYCEWFDAPREADGALLKICRHSGYLAGRHCTETEGILLPKSATKSNVCPYCREVRLSSDGSYRIADRSEPTRTERLFSLPPVMEHYYKTGHPEYRPLPPIKQREADEEESPMRFIYPADGSIVKRPRQADGSFGAIVCKAAHSDPSTELFWHLDTRYLGSTRDLHQCAIRPSRGCHTVTVVDADGSSMSINLIVM
ncbi:penicillin-binding protein 1C [Alistipes finegoldii]|uniref:penicillin-binding protein 1C n=1 Tax=Alistipes finegoldii TaxID=214856 RepID=UPI003AF9293C